MWRVKLMFVALVVGFVPGRVSGEEPRPSLRSAAERLAVRMAADLGRLPQPVPTAFAVIPSQDTDSETVRAAVLVNQALRRQGLQVVLPHTEPGGGPVESPTIGVRTRRLAEGHLLELDGDGQLYQTLYLDKDWVDGAPQARTNASAYEVRVHSELRFEESEARDESEGRLRDKLLALLTDRAGARAISHRDLRARLGNLLRARGVLRDEYLEKVEKPYGVMFRHHAFATVPQDVVTRFLADTAGSVRTLAWLRLGAGVFTLASLLASYGLAVALDRWTRGYRRGPIFAAITTALLALTGGLWWVVLT